MKACYHGLALVALATIVCWQQGSQRAELRRLSRELDTLAEQVARAPRGTPGPVIAGPLAPDDLLHRTAADASPPPTATLERERFGAPTPAAPCAKTEAPMDSLEHLAEVQNRFLRDPIDAGWAGSAERGLGERIGPLLKDHGRLQRVECRGTLCRMETLHQSAVDVQLFMGEAFQDPDNPLWRGAVQSEPPEPLPDGHVRAVAYLVREPDPR